MIFVFGDAGGGGGWTCNQKHCITIFYFTTICMCDLYCQFWNAEVAVFKMVD